MENIEIRKRLLEHGLMQKDLARELMITQRHMSRVLGHPLTAKMRVQIENALRKLEGEQRT